MRHWVWCLMLGGWQHLMIDMESIAFTFNIGANNNFDVYINIVKAHLKVSPHHPPSTFWYIWKLRGIHIDCVETGNINFPNSTMSNWNKLSSAHTFDRRDLNLMADDGSARYLKQNEKRTHNAYAATTTTEKNTKWNCQIIIIKWSEGEWRVIWNICENCQRSLTLPSSNIKIYSVLTASPNFGRVKKMSICLKQTASRLCSRCRS